MPEYSSLDLATLDFNTSCASCAAYIPTPNAPTAAVKGNTTLETEPIEVANPPFKAVDNPFVATLVALLVVDTVFIAFVSVPTPLLTPENTLLRVPTPFTIPPNAFVTPPIAIVHLEADIIDSICSSDKLPIMSASFLIPSVTASITGTRLSPKFPKNAFLSSFKALSNSLPLVLFTFSNPFWVSPKLLFITFNISLNSLPWLVANTSPAFPASALPNISVNDNPLSLA